MKGKPLLYINQIVHELLFLWMALHRNIPFLLSVHSIIVQILVAERLYESLFIVTKLALTDFFSSVLYLYSKAHTI